MAMSSLSDALANPEADLIFREAKLFFDSFLYCPEEADDKDSAIATYYRRLYFDATKDLEVDHRRKLLHICFGFKRKQRILQWLDDLEPDSFDFIAPLKKVVEERGRDTLFVTTSSTNQDGVLNELCVREDRPHFVIPTLSLAFPTHFFLALVHQAPLETLTAERFLTFPAALLLRLDDTLETRLRNGYLQTFLPEWEGAERDGWNVFFDHLLEGRKELFDSSFRRRVIGDVSEYDGEDLRIYAEKWFAQRQMKGNREIGDRIRQELNKQDGAKKWSIRIESDEDETDTVHVKGPWSKRGLGAKGALEQKGPWSKRVTWKDDLG